MKRVLFCMAALTCTMAAFSQTGKEWDDPKITSVNREVSHTIAIP